MPSFSTRVVIFLRDCPRKKKYVYEERITLWKARNETAAIRKAEAEAKRYAMEGNGRYLEFVQCY